MSDVTDSKVGELLEQLTALRLKVEVLEDENQELVAGTKGGDEMEEDKGVVGEQREKDDKDFGEIQDRQPHPKAALPRVPQLPTRDSPAGFRGDEPPQEEPGSLNVPCPPPPRDFLDRREVQAPHHHDRSAYRNLLGRARRRKASGEEKSQRALALQQ